MMNGPFSRTAEGYPAHPAQVTLRQVGYNGQKTRITVSDNGKVAAVRRTSSSVNGFHCADRKRCCV